MHVWLAFWGHAVCLARRDMYPKQTHSTMVSRVHRPFFLGQARSTIARLQSSLPSRQPDFENKRTGNPMISRVSNGYPTNKKAENERHWGVFPGREYLSVRTMLPEQGYIYRSTRRSRECMETRRPPCGLTPKKLDYWELLRPVQHGSF